MAKKTIWFRVVKGALQPADQFSARELANRNYRVGDLVKGDITKPNNPKFNRLIHKIGVLASIHLDDFKNLDAHDVLKRLQIEGGIACDEIAIKVDGYGMMMHRQAKSMSFEEMEEGERSKMAKAFCNYIAEKYWPDMSPDQIEAMAEVVDKVGIQ